MTNQTINSRQCNFNDVVKRAIEKLKPAIRESGAVVTFETMPSLNADSPSMVVVLVNLISSAIESHGQDRLHVHIAAHSEGDEWTFSVTDNGLGLADAEHIFDVQERLCSTSDLSMAICRKIVENHGGRIWAESMQGSGSTFYFTIPE